MAVLAAAPAEPCGTAPTGAEPEVAGAPLLSAGAETAALAEAAAVSAPALSRVWHPPAPTSNTNRASALRRGCRFASNTETGPAIALGMDRRALLLSTSALAGGAALGGCASDRAPPGRVIVPLWFTYGGKNRTTLETLVGRFNQSQADVWVRAVFQGDYFEGLAKLRTALAAGVAPPISHVVGEVVPYLAEAGVLEPLDQYPGARELPILPALGQAGSFTQGDQQPLVVVPFNRSTPIAYLNRRLFEQQGRPAPKTWDELSDAARALTSRTGSTPRFGFGCPIDWWFWAALVGQAGGEVVEPDGRVSLGGRAGIEALGFWQKLVREGVAALTQSLPRVLRGQKAIMDLAATATWGDARLAEIVVQGDVRHCSDPGRRGATETRVTVRCWVPH